MLEEILHIFTDPAHVVSELMWEGSFALISVFGLRRWVKRHDKEHHPEPPGCTCGVQVCGLDNQEESTGHAKSME